MMSVLKRIGLPTLLGLVVAAGSATAGTIIVSGDENITNGLVGNAVPINPGDQRFFSNILGGGTRVLVQGQDLTGADTPVTNTNTYYNTLAGVTSTIQSGAVTSAALAGVNLFVSAIPPSAFAASEITALSAFSAAGGTILLMGDNSGFVPVPNANLNALLAGLGSPLRILPDALDSGFQTTTAGQIVANPLTTGVSAFGYAFVSQVTGGTPLFLTKGGQTFVADNIPTAADTPEPSSLVLAAIGGVMGLAYLRRPRRRAGV
jgi:hypothetical protein